jgi:hypothetical protein
MKKQVRRKNNPVTFPSLSTPSNVDKNSLYMKINYDTFLNT